MNAIEIMMEEHKNIEDLLNALEIECLSLINGSEVDDEYFRLVIDFIRNYADSHHHKKEEILLFNRMVDEIGTTAEKLVKYGMLVEHDLGRLYVSQLEDALNRYKNGEKEAKLDIIGNSYSYMDLLKRHIFKENNVAYKYAERELSSEILNLINEECIKFEEENRLVREKYINILNKLKNKNC